MRRHYSTWENRGILTVLHRQQAVRVCAILPPCTPFAPSASSVLTFAAFAASMVRRSPTSGVTGDVLLVYEVPLRLGFWGGEIGMHVHNKEE